MATFVEAPTRTFRASAALAQFRRVHLDGSGELEYCSDVHTDCLGVTEQAALAADENISVRLHNADGTKLFVAADAIAVGGAVYAAASGKVQAAGTVLVGEALTASSTDGDYIEVLESAASILGSIARTGLTEDALQPYTIPMDAFRVWDAPATNIVSATAANDDLALVDNTFLTLAPTIEAGDLKAANAVSRKVRFQFALPAEYVAAGDVKVRINAGMKTTVAGVSCTVDVEAVDTATPNTDICATAAQSINNLVAANKDFVITATNLVAGDILDVVITVACNDAATGTAVIPQINKVQVLCDIKG